MKIYVEAYLSFLCFKKKIYFLPPTVIRTRLAVRRCCTVKVASASPKFVLLAKRSCWKLSEQVLSVKNVIFIFGDGLSLIMKNQTRWLGIFPVNLKTTYSRFPYTPEFLVVVLMDFAIVILVEKCYEILNLINS